MREPRVLETPLLLLDYDGTLAEIVPDPEAAFPHPEVPALLRALRGRYPVYLVSGRSVASLSRLLDVPGLEVVGVHGMEAGKLGEAATPLVAEDDLASLHTLREQLLEIPGLKVEDKELAIALHYREVDAAGVDRLKTWVENAPPSLDRLWGKKVLELRPHGYSKGRTATRLAAEHPRATPLFIGDDTTDEEAFAAIPQGLTVKVGEGDTQAQTRLPDVAAVVAYLKRYLPEPQT
jgi:trehalose 6-phosphate phosphatase